MKHLALLLLLSANSALASGPVAPAGWEASFAANLPNGAACCLPADLNGTKLVGGAFVLLSSDKNDFGLFALTYTPPLKEHWQLLERHPASALPAFQFSVVPPGQFPHSAIKACTSADKCTYWFTPSSSSSLRRTNNSFKPEPLRGSA
jgi:hypothetical protein